MTVTLTHLNNRYNDAELGRFVSVDLLVTVSYDGDVQIANAPRDPEADGQPPRQPQH